MKKILDLTGTESAYWLNVANNYSGKYCVSIDDFRVYNKKDSITFNSSNREYLLSTGDKDILEFAYWWDLYWGASTKKDSEYYVGVNALGRLHMEIRNKNN